MTMILVHDHNIGHTYSSTQIDVKNEFLDPKNPYLHVYMSILKEQVFFSIFLHFWPSVLWKDHINSIRSKLSSATFALSKVKNILPEISKLTIYNSLFRCHLEYCNIAWGNCNSSLLMQLQKLQKKSLRHIANKKTTSHVKCKPSVQKVQFAEH